MQDKYNRNKDNSVYNEIINQYEKRMSELCSSQNIFINKISLIVKVGISILTLIFIFTTSIATYKASVEKDEINRRFNELKNDIEKKIGNLQPAKIEIIDPSDKKSPLFGRLLETNIILDHENDIVCNYSFLLKNTGGESTKDLIHVISYCNPPFKLVAESYDESNYKYSRKTPLFDPIGQYGIFTKYQPQMIWGCNLYSYIEEDAALTPGKYKTKVKIYYGGNEPTESEFFINIDENDVRDYMNLRDKKNLTSNSTRNKG